MSLELDHLGFRYQDMAMDFHVTFPAAAFSAVIGPSGVDGRDITSLPPDQRPVSMIFQDNNVFSHLDLYQNVALGMSPGLRLDAGQAEQVRTALSDVGLAALAHRKPGEISGGERQRVALARALVRDRPVLLLDEPFAALGPALRRDMLDLVMAHQQARKLTVVMVTHQPEDAAHAASHTAFLDDGRILALRPTAALFSANDIPGLDRYLGDWRSSAL
jgi:thiamine transport system ATP-binding protein